MNIHAEFLSCLERIRSIDAKVTADELRGCSEAFGTRRWITREGYQTSILVPVLCVEEEVDVSVDDERGTYSYRSPAHPGRLITRAIEDISTYTLNVDAWLDSMAQILEIENVQRPRKRDVISGHLWHVGNLRAGRTHRFAPVYVARRLAQCTEDWRKPMFDAVRPGDGIVLTSGEFDWQLPNGHQQCRLDALLIADAAGVACDRDVMTRLLRGVPADAADPDDWFDERTGELKLHHMASPKVFKGKQKAVIAVFWKAREQASLKWSEVVEKTGCSKDPDSALGPNWNVWIEKTDYARYRIRTRRRLN